MDHRIALYEEIPDLDEFSPLEKMQLATSLHIYAAIVENTITPPDMPVRPGLLQHN